MTRAPLIISTRHYSSLHDLEVYADWRYRTNAPSVPHGLWQLLKQHGVRGSHQLHCCDGLYGEFNIGFGGESGSGSARLGSRLVLLADAAIRGSSKVTFNSSTYGYGCKSLTRAKLNLKEVYEENLYLRGSLPSTRKQRPCRVESKKTLAGGGIEKS